MAIWSFFLPFRLLTSLIFIAIATSLTQDLLNGSCRGSQRPRQRFLRDARPAMVALTTLQGLLERRHLVRISLDACNFHYRTNRAAGDNTGTAGSRFHQHAACAERTDYFVRNGRAFQGNLDQIFLGVLNAFADRVRNLGRTYPMPKPTVPLPSPTTTSAANLKIRPPLTVLDTRLMATTFSCRSSSRCINSSQMYSPPP